MKAGPFLSMFKTAGQDFLTDGAMTLAAAVAFYAALSMAPMLVLFLALAGLAGPGAQQQVVEQVQTLVGPQAGEAVSAVVESASEQQAAATPSAILSLLVLLFSASGVFAQFQQAMDQIWDVEARPGQGVWGWLRTRLLSIGVVLAAAFLLMTSLVVSAVINVMVPRGGPLWDLINLAVSLLIFALLFAVIFKFLPDVEITWSDVWVGAAVTAVLLAVGKYAIGLYLGTSAVGSAYGAAGSVVVLLVWVYYSAIIVFFGAELTQVYARRYGSGIHPSRHAVRLGRLTDEPAPAA